MSELIASKLHDDGVFEVVIARPPVNAFSIPLLSELAAVLGDTSRPSDARVVLLRAAGRGFCGGGDVKEVESLPAYEGILGQARGSLNASLSIARCAVPVICSIHAYCIGVGVLIAGAADIIVASQRTRFVLSEVDNGATAGGVLALKLMPEKRVRAAMMTAEPVFAEELHALGTVYGVLPAEDLQSHALELARKVAAKAPAVLRGLKQSLNHSALTHQLEAAYRAELSYTYELNISGEASAGRNAFIDGKRAGYLAEK